ncbi:hypothetical protein DL96DRAFT_1590755 [Flagelloscypha sp. PMI_526]|nr:hypothetical protein DL96DRAFT_1590755 [Flagelloscypha sp. PMI_526]
MTSFVLNQRQGRIPTEIQDNIFSLVATTSRVDHLLYTNVRIEDLLTLKLFLSLPRPLVQALQIGNCPRLPSFTERKELEHTYQDVLLGQVPEMCPNVQKLALHFVPERDKGLCFRMKHLKCLSILDPDRFAQYITDPDSEEEPATDDEGQGDIHHEVGASGEGMNPTELRAPKLAFHSLTHIYLGDTVPWDGSEFLIPLSCFPALTHLALFADPYSEEAQSSMIADAIEEWITKVPSIQMLILRFGENWCSEEPTDAWHQYVRSLYPSHPARADNRIVCVKMSEVDDIGNEGQFEFMNRLWAFAESAQKVPPTRDIMRFSL